MNMGKTLFAQGMEFAPWKTFARIIERHKGDAGGCTPGCAGLFRIMFRIMAFSQLTWREPLRVEFSLFEEAADIRWFVPENSWPVARVCGG